MESIFIFAAKSPILMPIPNFNYDWSGGHGSGKENVG
jgi:hypothetical protein